MGEQGFDRGFVIRPASGKQLYVGTMTNEVKGIDLVKKAVLWTYESQKAQPFYGSAAVTDT